MIVPNRWSAALHRLASRARSRRVLLWAALLAAALFLYFRTDWAEFGRYFGPIEKDPQGKTLWDWLDLLIIPITLGFAAMIFNSQARKHDLRLAAEQRKNDLQISDNRSQESQLSNYFDQMTGLILEHRLTEVFHLPPEVQERLFLRTVASEPQLPNDLPEDVESMRHVLRLAQSRTVTVLRQLDKTRQNIVLQFLRDADLDNFLLTNLSLEWVDLRDTNLYGANLSRSYMRRSQINNAILSKARLSGAMLREAVLSGADLSEAVLDGTDLRDARMDCVDLHDADLRGADLVGADLSRADLRRADMRGARLSRATLAGADLFGAKIDSDEMSTVLSFRGATMPDGMLYDPDHHRALPRSPEPSSPTVQTE